MCLTYTDRKILPVIINVHGGGLIIGNKEFNRYFCALLCKKGFLVYSIEYRLIPDCLIYDQIADVFMAMDYIKERLAADGGDSSHVYMAGDSGGACLITYVNAIQNSTNIARAANVTPSGLPFITRIIRDCIFINVPFRGLLIFKTIVLLIPFFYRRVTLSGIPFGSMSE